MEEIIKILNEYHKPFYEDVGFWIGIVVGLISVLFSIIAFLEAKKAKEAAKEAGRTVKIQTITIELTEIIPRLDKLDLNINYQDARDFYSEINRKLRRILAPYKDDDDFKSGIKEIFTCLDNLKTSLEGVKPYNKNLDEITTGNIVYLAIESEISSLCGKLAELTGLFEQKNISK
jgi:hypothetical protein